MPFTFSQVRYFKRLVVYCFWRRKESKLSDCLIKARELSNFRGVMICALLRNEIESTLKYSHFQFEKLTSYIWHVILTNEKLMICLFVDKSYWLISYDNRNIVKLWCIKTLPSPVKVYYSPTNAQVLKTILKLTLKYLRHISVQSHHLQGAHPCLLKLHFVKIVNYDSTGYDLIRGDVAAYIGSVLVEVCMSHCWCVYVALFGSRLLPNSATYTHQQGLYQYMQPHHHWFNHTLMNHNLLF
jgi:hypothetical protein